MEWWDNLYLNEGTPRLIFVMNEPLSTTRFRDSGTFQSLRIFFGHVSCVLVDGREDHPRQVGNIVLTFPGPDKCNIGSIPNGRSTLALLTIILLLLFFLMRSFPRIQSKLKCLMQGRLDRYSTRCHTPKLRPVRLSRSSKWSQ